MSVYERMFDIANVELCWYMIVAGLLMLALWCYVYYANHDQIASDAARYCPDTIFFYHNRELCERIGVTP